MYWLVPQVTRTYYDSTIIETTWYQHKNGCTVELSREIGNSAGMQKNSFKSMDSNSPTHAL